jgi:hypothetical protein
MQATIHSLSGSTIQRLTREETFASMQSGLLNALKLPNVHGRWIRQIDKSVVQIHEELTTGTYFFQLEAEPHNWCTLFKVDIALLVEW